MVWLLSVVLFAFFVISFRGAHIVWHVFASKLPFRVCGVAAFVSSVFIALTAVFGGITLALGVDKFPPEWLVDTPFHSYTIPGLILTLVVGGSAAVAASALVRGPSAGAPASIIAGIILLGWLLGERLILPAVAFTPQFWWLEAIYITAGLLMLLPELVAWQTRHGQTRPSSPSL